jgi:hypothetical protein
VSEISIEIRQTWGCVLAVYEDDAQMTHRCWLDVTDDNRYVLLSEVIVDATGTFKSRHYVPTDEMELPEKVREALIEYGADEILLRGDIE